MVTVLIGSYAIRTVARVGIGFQLVVDTGCCIPAMLHYVVRWNSEVNFSRLIYETSKCF